LFFIGNAFYKGEFYKGEFYELESASLRTYDCTGKKYNKGSSEALPFPAFALNEPENSGGRTWCRNF